EDRAEHAIGDLSGHGASPWPLHAEHDRHALLRPELELDRVQVKALAMEVESLAGEEPPDDLDRLAEVSQRRLEGDPHLLLDPPPIARAETKDDASGRRARQ